MGSAGNVRLIVVDDQALVRDAVAALARSWADFEVLGTAASIEALDALVDRLIPDVVLLSVSTQPDFFEAVGRLMARSLVNVVLFDEATYDVHAQQALRINAAGYLTKCQPALQIELALRQAALGERVYAPDVAARLLLSVNGVKLAPNVRDNVLAPLTPREIDVLTHVARGYTVKQTAQALGISASTVDNHKSRLMKKLRLHKAVELTHLVLQVGLLPCNSAGAPAPLGGSHPLPTAASA